MRTRHLVGVVAVTTALVAGCAGGPGTAGDLPVATGPVPLHPAPVTGRSVSGSVTDSRGHIAAGATVVAAIVLSRGESAERNAKSALTLGLGCLDQEGCTTPATTGRVAGDGRFALPMPRGVAAASDPLAITVVAARGSTARVATTVIVPRPATGSIAAGDIPLAADPPRLLRQGSHARLVMPVAAGAAGAGSVLLSRADPVQSGQQFVQRPPTTDVSGGYDRRLVEDGQVLLVGTESGRVAGRAAEFSASLVTTDTLVPRSRGARCTVTGRGGDDIRQKPCGLTDGVLDEAWHPADDHRCDNDGCGRVRTVTVTMARPVPASLLVIRGCGFTCSVGVSADARTFGSWRTAGDGSPDGLFMLHLNGVAVRAVRIHIAGGGFLDSLREVSVFG